MYDLKAVLIHRGPSAYSGHYIAHIKDSDSQNWHKFNDVTIEKIGGRNLQLGNEDDVGKCYVFLLIVSIFMHCDQFGNTICCLPNKAVVFLLCTF